VESVVVAAVLPLREWADVYEGLSAAVEPKGCETSDSFSDRILGVELYLVDMDFWINFNMEVWLGQIATFAGAEVFPECESECFEEMLTFTVRDIVYLS